MRGYAGRVFRLERHLERFSGTCLGLGRRLPWPEKTLAAWVRRSLEESRLKESVLRLSLHGSSEQTGVAMLVVREWTVIPADKLKQGIWLTTAVPRRPSPKAQDAQMKSSQFMNGVLALLDEGGGERLVLGPLGTVAEGTVSNIFIVRGKSLLTPSVSSGILKGVTRAVVMEIAQKNGLRVEESFLTRHEIYNADECFMTSTTSEILPVTRVDGRRIGPGRPGPVTYRLRKAFQKETRGEK